MQETKNKTIFVDLDGTLLNKYGIVTEDNKRNDKTNNKKRK